MSNNIKKEIWDAKSGEFSDSHNDPDKVPSSPVPVQVRSPSSILFFFLISSSDKSPLITELMISLEMLETKISQPSGHKGRIVEAISKMAF